jgi:hypothetical protein
MYVFPASHLKVHAANEPGRAGEQKPLLLSFLLLAESILLLAVSVFSGCRNFPMSSPSTLCLQTNLC